MADGDRRGRPPPRSTQRPAQRARSADPARLTAYTVLRAVAVGAYANLELPRVLRDRGVRGRDAGFATELTYGATRMRGLYDPIIATAAERPLTRVDEAVLDTLRLGTHQILAMRVPDHAAVAETVALARQVNGAGAAGFVNAVLRRVSERSREQWVEQVAGGSAGPTDPLGRLAVEHSHPEWIVRALRAALLGHRAATPESVEADLVRLLEADNAAPAVSLVARPGLAGRGELLESGAVPSRLSPFGAVLEHGDPGGIPAVRQGRAAVQDEASQLVAVALAAADVHVPAATEPAGPPPQWLDLCAGPGGKAALLAALGTGPGAALRANDVSPHRAELVRQTLAAAIGGGAQVEVTVADGRQVGREQPESYARVLVDAACTGLGALRRRPEARWRRTPQDLAGLGRLQRELLVSAIEATQPGGVVGYATCSPHLAETSFVVSDVLKKRGDVRVEDARGLFRDASGEQVGDTGAGPYVQLWPHVHGTDAMFFALLRKH